MVFGAGERRDGRGGAGASSCVQHMRARYSYLARIVAAERRSRGSQLATRRVYRTDRKLAPDRADGKKGATWGTALLAGRRGETSWKRGGVREGAAQPEIRRCEKLLETGGRHF